MSESTAVEVKISPSFNKEDADVILISNEGVQFHVHRKDLVYHSSFFSDLFELGKNTEIGNRPEIKLDETSATLEVGLRYCYPGSKPLIELKAHSREGLLDLIKFFDKNVLLNGLDAIRDAFTFEFLVKGLESHWNEYGALFAIKFEYYKLLQSLLPVLIFEPNSETSASREYRSDFFEVERKKLMSFVERNQLKTHKEAARSTKLLVGKLEASKHDSDCTGINMLAIWIDWRRITSLEGIHQNASPIKQGSDCCFKCRDLVAEVFAPLKISMDALKQEISLSEI